MSAHQVLVEAVRAVLGAGPELELNGVFDAPPARGVRPYVIIEDAVLVDWSTKDMAGREGRLAVGLFETGEDRVWLRARTDQITNAIAELPRELGEGWRIVSLAFLRSRIAGEGQGLSMAVIEFRVRMLQAN